MNNINKIQRVFNEEYDSTYIVAEIGVNHNGSIDTALKLIHKANAAGVDAVKFQKRNLNEIYTKDILDDPNSAEWNFEYLIPLLKEVELSKRDYVRIKKTCKELNLELIITPMDEDSVEFVGELGVDAFKVASADMTNLSLVKKCSQYNLPIIISTGMWGEEDIKKCVEFYKKHNIKYALLLANSTYPAPYEDLGLYFINKLKDLSKVVGYSGHERDVFIPVAAVTLGAKIIEKHITLDRSQKGPDHKASLIPSQWKVMVNNIRLLEKSLTYKKHINQAEILNREVFAKSAVAKSKLDSGHIFLENDVYFKSPGKGIFQHEMSSFIGKELKRNISGDKYVSKEDFKVETLIKNWKNFDFSKKWGVKCRFHDYDLYKELKTPVMEFHCSQTDLDLEFNEVNNDSELIIHAPEIVDREIVDICSTNTRIVNKSIDIIQKTIDKTIEISKNWPLAKPKLVVHLGGMSTDLLETTKYGIEELSTHQEMISIAIHNFKKLKFSKDEIDILPENLPPRPWYLGGEWYQYAYGPYDDMIRFCKEFDLKMTFDLSHAQLWCNMNNSNLEDYSKKIIPYVAHMHISDAVGLNGEGIQIDEGDVDFKKVFNIFKDYNYSWVTEIWSGHLHNGCGTYKALCDLETNYSRLL